MEQASLSMGLTDDKWRSNTELQRQRNTMLMVLKKKEKIEFIKWAKEFDANPLGYVRFCQGQYQLPSTVALQIMALGYISDINEVKRLHDEEDISVKWTPIPFGITKEEWDDPEKVKETIIDRKGSIGSSSSSEEESDEEVHLGMNINILEEVADESDSEPEPDPDSEIRSFVCENPKDPEPN